MDELYIQSSAVKGQRDALSKTLIKVLLGKVIVSLSEKPGCGGLAARQESSLEEGLITQNRLSEYSVSVVS